MSEQDKLILCVGMCTFDLIHVCREYPEEDSKRRILEGRWQRGGNASNACTVLRQLGDKCEFIGPLSNSKACSFVIEDFKSRGILIDHCVLHSTSMLPFSSIVLSETTGSRTIIHSNADMPIFTADDFFKISFERYKWIHFEAQHASEEKAMIDSILAWNAKNPTDRIVISVELEHLKKDILSLVKDADIVFLSRDYAELLQWTSKEVAIHNLRKYVKKEAKLICAWGSEGAIGIDNETDAFFVVTAKPPIKVVDSLGAGDSFIASTIHSLANGASLKDAIDFGCRIAGAKIGFHGFDCISSIYSNKTF